MYYGKALSYDYMPIENIDLISHEAFRPQKKRQRINFRRVFRKAGIKRVSTNVNNITLSILQDYLKRVLTRAIDIARAHKHKTLSLIHISYALK